MRSAHTRVLTRLLARGFYQEHTGLLLSLFVLVFINFFYTNVLNQSHLTPAQLRETALKLVLSTVSELLGVLLFAAILLIYSVKTWQYVQARLQAPDTAFLFYSINALPPARQLRAWAVVQLAMSVPLVVLGGYAMLVGLAYGYWLVPLLIPVYLLALTAYGARRYLSFTNNLTAPEAEPTQAIGFRWLNSAPKPLWSLFLWEIVRRRQLAYAITKAASLVCVGLILAVFPDAHSDLRLIGLLSLCVALTHAVLVYQASEFELTYLRFARNFPHSKARQYGQQAALYSVLLLPEILGLGLATASLKALPGALLLVGVTLLFRAVLYWLGPQMKPYLRLVFGLFIAFLLLNLFGLTLLLAAGSFAAAWLLLYYHRPSE